MNTPSILALMSLSTAVLAQGSQVIITPGTRAAHAAPATRMLVSWIPGEVRCADGVVAGSNVRRPFGELRWQLSTPVRPVTLRFAIDEGGRPVSIEREDGRVQPHTVDAAPALAASRFVASAPHDECSVTYSASEHPLRTAPIPDLVSYSVTPTSVALPQEGWDRIAQGANCMDVPRPQPLARAFPNFREVPATPGVKDWALVAFDTDASGKVGNARIATGTGNKALNAASIKAAHESRYTKGRRTGCLYPYWRAPGTLAAPAMPDDGAFRSAGATCTPERAWKTAPVLRFPEPWRRRRIEGWAIVSYDTAPWGEVGNVKVLAAQPSGEFGRQAVQIIGRATVEPSAHGMTGCVDRVRFVMGPEDALRRDNDTVSPLY